MTLGARTSGGAWRRGTRWASCLRAWRGGFAGPRQERGSRGRVPATTGWQLRARERGPRVHARRRRRGRGTGRRLVLSLLPLATTLGPRAPRPPARRHSTQSTRSKRTTAVPSACGRSSPASPHPSSSESAGALVVRRTLGRERPVALRCPQPDCAALVWLHSCVRAEKGGSRSLGESAWSHLAGMMAS